MMFPLVAWNDCHEIKPKKRIRKESAKRKSNVRGRLGEATSQDLEYCFHRAPAAPPVLSQAANVGFADQSHMTRHFLTTFRLTPGRWLQIVDNVSRD
ncbi:helix-turn-helix domain-containing protein [Pararobbsia alpina]|nr:helix-turn-helix domain-containing protein [Pararobbsia alpina]